MLKDDARGVLIAKSQIDLPQHLVVVACAHGDEGAIHGLGISDLAVGTMAEALTHLIVIFLTPQFLAALAVNGGGHAVRSDDDHTVRRHDWHDVARTVEVHTLAVVPLPVKSPSAAIERAQVGIPSPENDIIAVNDG